MGVGIGNNAISGVADQAVTPNVNIRGRLRQRKSAVSTKRQRPILSALAVLCIAVSQPCLSAGAQDTEEELEAIANVIRSTTSAFNAHDAEVFASLYTPDATLVTVRGERMTGTAEIEHGLDAIFATRAKTAKLETIDTSISLLTQDVAIAYVLNELTGNVTANGEPAPPHRELSIRVLLKKDGKWRVAAFHNTIVQPVGP